MMRDPEDRDGVAELLVPVTLFSKRKTPAVKLLLMS